jgi:hypothetical protein
MVNYCRLGFSEVLAQAHLGPSIPDKVREKSCVPYKTNVGNIHLIFALPTEKKAGYGIASSVILTSQPTKSVHFKMMCRTLMTCMSSVYACVQMILASTVPPQNSIDCENSGSYGGEYDV